MMSSLREEIGKVIWKIPWTNAYTVQNYTDTITDIVSIFEKRIDEMMPDSEYQLITKGRIKEMLK